LALNGGEIDVREIDAYCLQDPWKGSESSDLVKKKEKDHRSFGRVDSREDGGNPDRRGGDRVNGTCQGWTVNAPLGTGRMGDKSDRLAVFCVKKREITKNPHPPP